MAASRGRGARAKGASAEREAFALLNAELAGAPFQRNLTQTRLGGSDSEQHHPVAIEVKRQESLRLVQWLDQAVEQADELQTPVLMYRRNKESWRVLVVMDVPEFVDYLVRIHGYERDTANDSFGSSGGDSGDSSRVEAGGSQCRYAPNDPDRGACGDAGIPRA